MSVIDVTVALKTLQGADMIEPNPEGEATTATLRMALVNALLSPVQKESGVEKIKKYDLAMKIHKNDKVDLTAEEITLLKARVGEVFPVLIVGQVFEILEGKKNEDRSSS